MSETTISPFETSGNSPSNSTPGFEKFRDFQLAKIIFEEAVRQHKNGQLGQPIEISTPISFSVSSETLIQYTAADTKVKNLNALIGYAACIEHRNRKGESRAVFVFDKENGFEEIVRLGKDPAYQFSQGKYITPPRRLSDGVDMVLVRIEETNSLEKISDEEYKSSTQDLSTKAPQPSKNYLVAEPPSLLYGAPFAKGPLIKSLITDKVFVFMNEGNRTELELEIARREQIKGEVLASGRFARKQENPSHPLLQIMNPSPDLHEKFMAEVKRIYHERYNAERK